MEKGKPGNLTSSELLRQCLRPRSWRLRFKAWPFRSFWGTDDGSLCAQDGDAEAADMDLPSKSSHCSGQARRHLVRSVRTDGCTPAHPEARRAGGSNTCRRFSTGKNLLITLTALPRPGRTFTPQDQIDNNRFLHGA